MRGAFRLLACVCGSLSIGSLLLYFFGVGSFFWTSCILLLIEIGGLLLLWRYASGEAGRPMRRLIVGGLTAGCVATLAYDIVRVPIAHGGIPVFKAISYFGTVLLGVEQPTPVSELLGWGYHLSNGIGFGLMYAALVTRPGPISAVLWGLSLEGAMLLTPYAEVFGYQRDARFMAITIGSHACYGLALWAGLWYWNTQRLTAATIAASGLTTVLVLSLIAADFHRLEASKLPPSPPDRLGSDLYVTWDVPEPDRVAALWVMKRFERPAARFHFIAPFQALNNGTPFDVPEADIRRTGNRAATEVLLDRMPLEDDERLELLARTAHLTEVTAWMLPSDPAAADLARRLRDAASSHCGERLRASCLDPLFGALDAWYYAPTP